MGEVPQIPTSFEQQPAFFNYLLFRSVRQSIFEVCFAILEAGLAVYINNYENPSTRKNI